ncbi:MAG: hypothetical protein F6K17_39530 [Okeania sp. SIO3C4]|nr:hypothetical protein [Okeania sp. SIO3C4]
MYLGSNLLYHVRLNTYTLVEGRQKAAGAEGNIGSKGEGFLSLIDISKNQK